MYKKAMMLSAVLFLGLAAIGFADETPADNTPTNETPTVETQANDALAVEQATDQFYKNLNAMFAGDAAGMDQIWSHADDVTYMGPVGGIQTGWDQVRTMWDVRAELKLGGHVEPTELHFTVGKDLALVEGYELGSGVDAQGEPQEFRIRATSSFRKENGQWKMIGHHTDLFDTMDSDSDNASEEEPSAGSNVPSNATSNDDSIDVSEDEVILKLDE